MDNQLARRLLIAAFAVGVMASSSQPVLAQGSGLFTGSGLTKGGTGGITGGMTGSGFGSMTAGKAGTTPLMGGTTGPINPFAPPGAGGNAAQGGMAGAMGGMGAMGGANSGFIGRNSGAFAGNSRAGQVGAGAAGGAARNFRNSGNIGANDLRNSDFANGGKARKTSQVRPRQKVAFEYNAKAAATVAATASVRLDRMTLKNPSLKGVDVAVQDNQIVLRGRVKTSEQARLAENIVRLEPGVRSVRNELEVEQPAVEE